MRFKNTHKSNIYFDAEVGSLFPFLKEGKARFPFEDMHKHMEDTN